MADELIVVCNGPSLADVELSFLKSRPSFGANGIFYFDGFTPSVYFCYDQAFIVANQEPIREMARATATFIRRPWNEGIPGSKPICRVPETLWSHSPMEWTGSGGSVLFPMLQFAGASDAKKVLLVGLDYDYFDDPKTPDHFHPDYMKGVEHPFDNHPEETQLNYWKRMKTLCDQSNEMVVENFKRLKKEIINLTPNSQCDAFVKGDINDFS